MNEFDLATRKHGTVDAIVFRGPLVLGAAVNRLDEVVENLLAHGSVRFVVDMAEVKRLDSSGIGLLVRLLRICKQKGGSVKLIQPSRPAELALKMCNVLPLFEVYAEEEQALASFS